MGIYTPEFSFPLAGKYLWEWYTSVNDSISRIVEGHCRLIPPTEFHAWSIITGNLVYPIEYDILMTMDIAYCDEINKEIEDIQSKREQEQQKKK